MLYEDIEYVLSRLSLYEKGYLYLHLFNIYKIANPKNSEYLYSLSIVKYYLNKYFGFYHIILMDKVYNVLQKECYNEI